LIQYFDRNFVKLCKDRSKHDLLPSYEENRSFDTRRRKCSSHSIHSFDDNAERSADLTRCTGFGQEELVGVRLEARGGSAPYGGSMFKGSKFKVSEKRSGRALQFYCGNRVRNAVFVNLQGVCVLVCGGRAPLEQLPRFENSRNVEMKSGVGFISDRGSRVGDRSFAPTDQQSLCGVVLW
jgi:hypothetical protein